jgi:hypothetical protein
MWQRVDACPASCLDLKLVHGGTGLQGTDSCPWAHLGGGCEPAGGVYISFPRVALMKSDLDG